MIKQTLTAAAVALSLTTLSVHAADGAPESENDRLSYGLGLMIGERVLKNYGELNYDMLVEAMKAQAADAETHMTLDEAGQALQEHDRKVQEAMAAEAKAAGVAYLADNAERDGVTVTESGLQWEVITEGDGPKPGITDTVSVHYVGTLIDGTEFDSSISRGQPTQFPLNGVIPGWTEGLQLMNVGSKYRFVIPSDLAYGERGAGQQIAPGATLVFEVELLEIVTE